MTAKEARTLQLELHRMNRSTAEMHSQNRALEAECARLRARAKQEAELHAAKTDAVLKQCHALQTAHREMTETVQRERQAMAAQAEEMQQHMQKQTHQEATAQKQANFVELTALKRSLDARCAETIAIKTAELDAAKTALENALAAEKTARVQREQEHALHFLSRMEALENEKAAQLNEAKQKFDDECMQRMGVLQQRQTDLETQMRHYLALTEDLTRMKADAVRQLDTAKRALEEDRTRLLVAADNRFEDHVRNHALQIMKAVSFSHVSRAISANYAHMRMICHHLDFNEKRVLIYSHYSEREEVESYNYLILERMGPRFDYIVVLTNCPNQWQFAAPDYNKHHVLGYNFKSDFRNYGVFILQAAKQLKRAAQVCLMNDSFIVVDVAAFDRCMRRMFNQASPTWDFMGITSSYENCYHLQSYFMCFNNAGTVGAVMDYFNAHGLPMNHHVAISVYELGITSHLMARGFKPFAMVSNQEMPVPLNTTCFKWSAVLQATGIVKRQHFLKQYPPRIAMTDLNIALVASKFSENKHFTHFLNYHGIKCD
jgi:hypothetical protein